MASLRGFNATVEQSATTFSNACQVHNFPFKDKIYPPTQSQQLIFKNNKNCDKCMIQNNLFFISPIMMMLFKYLRTMMTVFLNFIFSFLFD